MRRSRLIGVFGLIAILLAFPTPARAVTHADTADIHAAGAGKKLIRGVVNIITGWVEIPKRARQTMEDQGAMSGLTWGLLRGLGYGFVRTAAGLYETFTFPFPAPPGYESVIQPEYIFDVEAG